MLSLFYCKQENLGKKFYELIDLHLLELYLVEKKNGETWPRCLLRNTRNQTKVDIKTLVLIETEEI